MNQNLFKEYEGVFAPTLEEVGGPTESVGQKKERVFEYNPFPLQDALGEKNIKKIWLEYQKLILADIKPEDLIHKIISKIKDMVAIQKGATALDLGIKDYPYTKSKRDLKNWKQKDLENFYTKLVLAYHHSRTGGDELGLAIEKSLLSL